ncbi:PAF15 factor, partial [Rhynochetos jubatus]|nr:PAF15 factor [Rhynochetos jubatus]
RAGGPRGARCEGPRRRSPLRSPLPAVLASRAPRKVLGSGSHNAGPSPPAKRGESGARRGLPSRLARPAAALTAALLLGESRRGRGNPVCVRPVPAWQRGIGEFLQELQKENREPGGEAAGTSG